MNHAIVFALMVLLPLGGRIDRSSANNAGRLSSLAPDTGIVAGITTIETESQVQNIGRALASFFEEPAHLVQSRLSRLRRAGGSAIYIQMKEHVEPAEIRLTPVDGEAVRMVLDNGATLSTSMPGSVQQVQPTIAVIWIERGGQAKYEIFVPRTVTRVTIVVGAREVVSAQDIELESDSLVWLLSVVDG